MGYYLGYYCGKFFIMAIILIAAIKFGRRSWAWILYGIAALLQLFSLLGTQKRYSAWEFQYAMTTEWVIYAALLIISAVIIALRRKKAEEEYYEETKNSLNKDEEDR